MKVIRAYRFRLYPTEFQEELFRRYVGSCRWLYNLALEQRELFSRRGRSIGYKDQAAELKTLKADEAFAWLAETPNQCLQQVLMDLQKAFTNFFEGRASYPKRRKKFENDAFRFPALEQKAIRKVKGQKVIGPDGEPERYTQAIIDLKEGVVDLPKIGSVRWCRHRKIEGKPKNLTVIREGEWWFASIVSEVDLAERHGPKLDVVAVDRNVKAPLALSTGKFFDLPRMTNGEAKRRKRLEQGIARCVEQRKEREKEAGQKLRRSKNEMKLRAALRGLHAALRRRLNDALHKVTTLLAKSHSVVVVEDLKIRNMTASARGTVEEPGTNVQQKAGLNRSLLALAPARFVLLLACKCRWYGSRLIGVPAPYTSQYCSRCRRHPKDDPETRHLDHGRDGMWFACPLCGHEEHADLNAAKNIEWAGRQILAAERLDEYDEYTAGGHPVSAWGALCEGMAMNHDVSVLTERSPVL